MANWKLVDAKTNFELNVGDLRITSRGEEVRIASLQPPHKPSSTGKVYVTFIGDSDTTAGYYPGVIDAKFVDLDEPAPSTDWKQRALDATRGTQLGSILCAALGEKKDAPFFSGRASITSDGFIMANFTGADGRGHMGALVGSVSDLVRNVRGLADHLKLDDADKAELFKVAREWIVIDYSNGAIKELKVA